MKTSKFFCIAAVLILLVTTGTMFAQNNDTYIQLERERNRSEQRTRRIEAVGNTSGRIINSIWRAKEERERQQTERERILINANTENNRINANRDVQMAQTNVRAMEIKMRYGARPRTGVALTIINQSSERLFITDQPNNQALALTIGPAGAGGNPRNTFIIKNPTLLNYIEVQRVIPISCSANRPFVLVELQMDSDTKAGVVINQDMIDKVCPAGDLVADAGLQKKK